MKFYLCRLPDRQPPPNTSYCDHSSQIKRAHRYDLLQPTSPELSLKRLLIVEDDAETCELLRHVLAGFDLTIVGHVRDALPTVRDTSFDIYLLDNWLPDGSGIELCKKIRELKPDSPILFTSAAAMQKNIDEAAAAGATQYLVKPYDPFHLRSIVKELLEIPEVQTLNV